MPDSFGARLRRRREEQHIALTTIAGQTKIKLSLLEGLERDDVSHWPSGLYRRSFIRAYAQAIGLDPDVVVREFLDLHPEPADVIASAAAIAAAVDGGATNGGAQNRLRSLVGSAFSRMRRSASSEDEVAAGPAPLKKLDPPEEDFFVDDDEPADGALAEVLAAPAPDGAAADCTPDDFPPHEFPPHEKKDEVKHEVVAQATAGSVDQAPFEPDLSAVAHLCTQFCMVEHSGEVKPLLQESARILGGTGVVVWLWDEAAEELAPVLAHGYSGRMLAQLPAVRRETDNPTAAAFRTARISAISGALVLPLITPGGCAGVLAIEVPDGREQMPSVRAVATIVAALLAQLLGARPDEAPAHAEAAIAPADDAHADGRSYTYRSATLTH